MANNIIVPAAIVTRGSNFVDVYKGKYGFTPVPPVPDPQTLLIEAAYTTQPSANYLSALDIYMKALRASGNLAKLDVLTSLPAEIRQNYTVDFAKPSRTMSESTPLPFWQALYAAWGNSTNMFQNLNYNPATNGINFTGTNNGISVFILENQPAVNIETGAFNGTIGNWVSAKYTDGNFYGRTGTSSVPKALTQSIGLLSYTYDGTNLKQYLNGVLVNTTAVSATSVPSVNAYGLSGNNAGSLQFPSGKKVALIAWHSGDIDIASLYSDTLNFFNNIGSGLTKLTVGFGDSFMYGQNASSQDADFFNVACKTKGYACLNYGVSGMAIATGGTQPGFDLTKIPYKVSGIHNKLIVNFGLNDAYNVYYDSSRTLSQVTAAVQAFITAAIAKGWATSDIFWITGFAIGTNIYYTPTQYATLTTAIRGVLTTNGVPTNTDFPSYPLNADGVHPVGDASYAIMAAHLATFI